MSLPGFISVPFKTTLSLTSSIDNIFNSFNTNPYFIGMMMLFLNLGGKFLSMEVSKNQEKVFQSVWVRRFVIFSVIFIATRNIFVAIVMSIILILLISFILNECSPLYLFKSPTNVSCSTSEQSLENTGLTESEYNTLQQLLKRQISANSIPEKRPSHVDLYHSNIQIFRH